MSGADDLARAQALHKQIIVFDGHVDIRETFGGAGHPADDDPQGQFDLGKAARGGLSGANICLGAPLNRSNPAGIAAGRRIHEAKFAAIEAMVRDFPAQAGFATSAAAFREIAAQDRLAIVLSLQNAAPFDGDLDAIRDWAARGVRMIGLAFIGNTAFADSARPYPFAGDFDNGGLSALGRDAVRLMNDLGVIVDVSQLSDAALVDTLEASRAPVIASHSAPRGVHETRRNLSDDDLRAIAGAGGLINIVGFANYIAPTDLDVNRQLRDMWMRYGLTDCKVMDDAIFHPQTALWDDETFWEFLHEFHVILDLGDPHASVDQFAGAVAYAVDTVGIEAVGLSSDFNHGGGLIGWRHAGEAHNMTAALMRRGFSDAEIAQLWGENFLRLWPRIQGLARS